MLKRISGAVLAVIGVWGLCGGAMLMLIQIISPRSYESFCEDVGKL